jgi:hypothetical protein
MKIWIKKFGTWGHVGIYKDIMIMINRTWKLKVGGVISRAGRGKERYWGDEEVWSTTYIYIHIHTYIHTHTYTHMKTA